MRARRRRRRIRSAPTQRQQGRRSEPDNASRRLAAARAHNASASSGRARGGGRAARRGTARRAAAGWLRCERACAAAAQPRAKLKGPPGGDGSPRGGGQWAGSGALRDEAAAAAADMHAGGDAQSTQERSARDAKCDAVRARSKCGPPEAARHITMRRDATAKTTSGRIVDKTRGPRLDDGDAGTAQHGRSRKGRTANLQSWRASLCSPSALPCVVTSLRASSSLPRARVSTTSVSNLCVKVALLPSRSVRQKRVGCKTTEQESVEWQRQRTKELASPTSPKTCNKFTSTERRLQPPWVWLSAHIRRRRRRGGEGESACTALRNSQPWQCTSA